MILEIVWIDYYFQTNILTYLRTNVQNYITKKSLKYPKKIFENSLKIFFKKVPYDKENVVKCKRMSLN